jgi:hypothetical protein
MAVDLDDTCRRLQPAVDMLGADGYELAISARGDVLHLRVTASESACADCLVSKDMFVDVIAHMLDGDAPEIVLEYPSDSGSGDGATT